MSGTCLASFSDQDTTVNEFTTSLITTPDISVAHLTSIPAKITIDHSEQQKTIHGTPHISVAYLSSITGQTTIVNTIGPTTKHQTFQWLILHLHRPEHQSEQHQKICHHTPGISVVISELCEHQRTYHHTPDIFLTHHTSFTDQNVIMHTWRLITTHQKFSDSHFVLHKPKHHSEHQKTDQHSPDVSLTHLTSFTGQNTTVNTRGLIATSDISATHTLHGPKYHHGH